MSGNQIFGLNNTITNSVACFAIGSNNAIVNGNSSSVDGSYNLVTGTNNHCDGIGNKVSGEENTCQGSIGAVTGFNNTCEGQQSHVTDFQNRAAGANHMVNGFQSTASGYGSTTATNTAGQNISGYKGIFLSNNSNFQTNPYNYSNQFAGGADAANNDSQYSGEGIGMIDHTILSGRYPIAQHQSYLNTSDGLSYSIMLKGEPGLKQGTFVTFSPCIKHKERLITKAPCTNDVIGVITLTSGFIANAGQFAASERIQYDQFHNPIIFYNCTKPPTNEISSANITSGVTGPIAGPSQQNENLEINTNKTGCGAGLVPVFPYKQSVPNPFVDRQAPFIPYTERDNYYQVALAGLVVVKAKRHAKIGNKCGVRKGYAVDGDQYWVVNYIDDQHLMILLK
jgi:hypothetical protein